MLHRAPSRGRRPPARLAGNPFGSAYDVLSRARWLPEVPGLESASPSLWLARAAAFAALTGEVAPSDPRSVVRGIRDAVGRLFGPRGPQAFPLLTGPRNGDSRRLVPELVEAARLMEHAIACPGDTDLLSAVYVAHPTLPTQEAPGQHHTPAPIVDLLHARIDAHFGAKRPPVVFDPAAGSGAFLVPLAARWRRAGLAAEGIVRRLRGAEVCAVSHALAQTNLLIQLGPMLRQGTTGPLPLPGLHNMDALRLFGSGDSPGYDVCIGNPPYLGERSNREAFDRLVDTNPALGRLRWARGDLAYWFLMLGLWSLRPGGLLGFVTPAYWLTADGASGLRGEIAERAHVLELIDFRDQSVFPTAPGEQTLVAVLRKREPGDGDAPLPTLTARVRRPGDLHAVVRHLREAISEARNNHADVVTDAIEVRWGSAFTSANVAGPWFIRCCNRVEAVLGHLASGGQELGGLLAVRQGLVSGADRVTPAAQRLMDQHGAPCRLGEGIFVLTREEVALAGIDASCRVIRPFFKNSDIRDHWVNEEPERYVLYVADGIGLADHLAVEAHLRRFLPVLARRRECLLGRMPWYRLHWPRTESVFTGLKIVCPQRAPENRFAFHEGDLFASADVYFLGSSAGSPDELRYYEALLNAAPLDFWFAKRGKRKGRLREYYATPLSALPVVPYEPGMADSGRVRSLLRAPGVDHAVDLVSRARWCRERGDEGALHRAMCTLAEALASCGKVLHRAIDPSAQYGVSRDFLAASLLEQHLRASRDELAMDIHGLTGDRAWMRQVVLDHRERALE